MGLLSWRGLAWRRAARHVPVVLARRVLLLARRVLPVLLLTGPLAARRRRRVGAPFYGLVLLLAGMVAGRGRPHGRDGHDLRGGPWPRGLLLLKPLLLVLVLLVGPLLVVVLLPLGVLAPFRLVLAPLRLLLLVGPLLLWPPRRRRRWLLVPRGAASWGLLRQLPGFLRAAAAASGVGPRLALQRRLHVLLLLLLRRRRRRRPRRSARGPAPAGGGRLPRLGRRAPSLPPLHRRRRAPAPPGRRTRCHGTLAALRTAASSAAPAVAVLVPGARATQWKFVTNELNPQGAQTP
jgi:hypothetical protein